MYRALFASAFQTQLAHRGQVWAGVFSQLIQVFFKIAIWRAVFRGAPEVDGVSLDQMITYTLLAGTLLGAWEWPRLIQAVDAAITSGDIAVFLLKPLGYPSYLLSTELGNLCFRLALVVLPSAAVVAAVYGLEPPASAWHGALFLPFCVLSFAMQFVLALGFGLLAFWLMTAFSLEWLLQGLFTLLSGSFVPLWFFPERLGALVRYSPFAWIGFHPVAVYLGKLSGGEALGYLALGAAWLALLGLGVLWLWRRATLRITIQGG